jgi:hypothetical protein
LDITSQGGKSPKGAADDIMFDVDLKLWVEVQVIPDGRLNGGGEPFVGLKKAAKYWKEII